MDPLLTTAASGLRARIESLDLLANNIANAGTAGFKADREYYGTYLSEESLDGPEGTLPAQSPVIDKNWTDYQQGVITSTGSPLDLALSGPGFFALQTDSGTIYTRNGSFRITPDGVLSSANGDPVLGIDGKSIRLDPKIPILIDDRGEIRQSGAVRGTLSVVDVDNRAALRKMGAVMFRYDAPNPTARQASAKVEQGRLESANSQPAESAVRLVNVLRQFEMLQRAISLGSEMNRRAIEDVAKI